MAYGKGRWRGLHMTAHSIPFTSIINRYVQSIAHVLCFAKKSRSPFEWDTFASLKVLILLIIVLQKYAILASSRAPGKENRKRKEVNIKIPTKGAILFFEGRNFSSKELLHLAWRQCIITKFCFHFFYINMTFIFF